MPRGGKRPGTGPKPKPKVSSIFSVKILDTIIEEIPSGKLRREWVENAFRKQIQEDKECF
jgi:hypothetical protein